MNRAFEQQIDLCVFRPTEATVSSKKKRGTGTKPRRRKCLRETARRMRFTGTHRPQGAKNMTAQEAFEKMQARELTRNTHVQTHRAQRTILQSLNDTGLAEVSLKLTQAADALSGKEGV